MRYKAENDVSKRREMAKKIYDRYLGPNSTDPVNVDAQARQTAQENLENAPPDSFEKVSV